VNTEDIVLSVKNAAAALCVNTEDDVLHVKNVVEAKFMNIVKYILNAKNVVVVRFANTDDIAVFANNVVVPDCVNIEGNVLIVRNAVAADFVNTTDYALDAVDVSQMVPIKCIYGMLEIGKYLSNYLSKTSNGLYLIRVHHAANLLNQWALIEWTTLRAIVSIMSSHFVTCAIA